jgi:hypothetical protein
MGLASLFPPYMATSPRACRSALASQDRPDAQKVKFARRPNNLGTRGFRQWPPAGWPAEIGAFTRFAAGIDSASPRRRPPPNGRGSIVSPNGFVSRHHDKKAARPCKHGCPCRTPNLRKRQDEYVCETLMFEIHEALMPEIQKRYAYLANTRASCLYYEYTSKMLVLLIYTARG